MKLSRPILLSAIPLALAPWAIPAYAQTQPLEVQIAAEEPTGVFYDRDTLSPQTPVLFTAKVQNTLDEERDVMVTWRITGPDGRVKWESGSRFTIAAGDSIIRRQLFDVPGRGGYLLEVTALARQKGPDATTRTQMPFAVVVSPSPRTTAARPHSFFVLSAPPNLSEPQLDFYTRIGARVLRSPLPADPTRPDWPAVEAQLAARVRRNLATVALLNVSDREGRTSEAYFSRQVPSTLAKYGPLTTWELSGDLSPADLDGWSQLARSRRSDVSLLGPLPAVVPAQPPISAATLRLNALDGATFNWPGAGTHPQALQRLWASRSAAAKSAGLPAVHLRRDELSVLTATEGTTGESAGGLLTTDFLGAIVAGANSLSEPLGPPAANENGSRVMSRAAAFAMMTRTLEDAIYREELYPGLAGMYGALFRAPRGSIAVLQSTGESGKMEARVAPARVYDVFGNPTGAVRNGVLEIPLTANPVYVLAEVPPDVLAFALRNAKVEDTTGLEAQILPLSRKPGPLQGEATVPAARVVATEGVPADSRPAGTVPARQPLAPPSTEAPAAQVPFAVRVRLQNTGLGRREGQLQLNPPSGWKLAQKKLSYGLAPGETKTYEFRVERSLAVREAVPFEISATFGSKRKSWRQQVPVATAENITPGSGPRLDGDLKDWQDAQWMDVKSADGSTSANVALRWDANRLFIAARVKEAGLVARRPDEPAYEFWNGHDALQLAFGFGDGPETVPGPQPFRDSDYGILLCPFNQRGTNEFDGRVLKLWAPDKPYNTIADRIRWGGHISGASCVISRDEKSGITTYEARLPLSALPELQPLEKSGRDQLVRFGWLLHNNEGPALDWGQTTGLFSWWRNTASFLPEGELTSPLRSTLGFTRSGDVDLGLEVRPAPRSTAPVPAAPPPVAVPLPGSRPTRPFAPGTVYGPPVQGSATSRTAPGTPAAARQGAPISGPVTPAAPSSLTPVPPAGPANSLSATPVKPVVPGPIRRGPAGAVPAPTVRPVAPAQPVAPTRSAPTAPPAKRPVLPASPGRELAPFPLPPAAPPTSPGATPPPDDGADLPPAGVSPAPPQPVAPAKPEAARPSRIRLLPMPSTAPPRAHLMPSDTN